ncbi:SGNH/GDSL hydrolase family protein [Microcella sp.]|uniref:SGNH/GDSL hydrolase family protein n=1 Tax=Microcella sp. TaxID=1913979 RepID=UPI00391DB7EA
MTWSLPTPFTAARQRAWQRRALEPGELLYVAIGDSAAQGVGARDLDASYVGLLAARLQRLTGRTVRVVNLSRYGARLDDALARQLPALAELQPDLVTVAIGANDMVAFDTERFSDEFGRLLSALPPHAIVADLPCFHFGDREWDAVRASRVIADLVRARGLAFAPLHRVTEKRRGWGSWPEFAWDQFHPSAIGYRVWESAFAGAVDRRAHAVGGAS